MERTLRWVVVALAVLAFLPSLGGGFVYDDVPIVQEDPRVRDGQVLAAVTGSYWVDGRGGLWRPTTTLVHVANGLVSRGPLAFHVVNLALHAACSVVALLLAERLVGRRGGFVAAVVFAVHPIHVEVATNIVGRAESLGFLLGGGAWLLARRERWAGAFALGLAAVLAKENAIALLLGAVLEAALERRFREAARALAVSGVVVVVALALRRAVLGTALTPADAGIVEFMNPLATQPLATRVANVPVVLGAYLRNLVFPVALAPDYGGSFLPLAKGLDDARWMPWALASALALAGPPLAARKPRPFLFASAFLLLGLGPVLQVVPIGTLVADRLAYTPSFAFAVALGAAAEALFQKLSSRKKMVTAGIAIVAGVLAALAADEARAWRDTRVLFERARPRVPGSVQVPLILASSYIQTGEHERAIEPLREASKLAPGDPGPLLKLGLCLRLTGQPREARIVLERALAIPHVREEAAGRSELGLVLWQLGDKEGAERELARSVELKEDARTLAILGQLRLDLGDRAGARKVLERSLELDPRQERAKDIRALLERL